MSNRLRLHKSSASLELTAPAYSLSFDRDRPWSVVLATGTGERIAELFVGSAVDTVRGRDALEQPEPPVISRRDEATEIIFAGRSSQWEQKRYVLSCTDGELAYRVEVTGRGKITWCRMLEGCLAEDVRALGLTGGRLRDGYERPYADLARGSRAFFKTYFTARPTAAERDWRTTWEDDLIDLIDDPLRHGGCDSFLPAPWAHAFELGEGEPWTAVGLLPRPDELEFSSYHLRTGTGFGFELGYDGRVTVEREWHSPELLFVFGGRDVSGALHGLFEATRARLPEAEAPAPEWLRQPVFDGGGQQEWLARGGDPAAECSLANYLDALAMLDEAGLRPGSIWIGPGWCGADPTVPDPLRWPDLKGFIARQHTEDRRVILTLPLFPPVDWDVASAAELVGPDGLDADGLRVTEVAPRDGCIGTLARRLADLRRVARQARPGAALLAPTVNPYFAGLVDAVTLGGLWTDRRSVAAMVRHRAELAELALPALPRLVTDRHAPSREAWLELVELAPELGVPVLSAVQGIAATGEGVTAEDLRLVARAWAKLQGT